MTGFFEKMPIHKAHIALVYISGIILILSIFVDVRVIDNLRIMILSSVTCLYGTFLWIVHDNLALYGDEFIAQVKLGAINKAKSSKMMISIIYIIVMLLILLYWYFPRSWLAAFV